ncbi:MAG: hypothetical protein D6760_08535 [Deltaproteobacteria bacterium]|nr:MAG: hypothetical protein D6760_08535 [Deltaproteobacteria bacterium]
MAGNWWLESITAGFGSPDWSRGSLTIQNNGTFSGSFTDIDGTPENVSGAKITMAADGSFTCDLCSALFRGTLDSGGTVAAITDTWDDGTVELLMALRKAPNYAQSDLTGAWKVNELLSPFPGWTRGDFTIQSNGALGGAVVTSSGENVTPSGTVTVMGDGTASCTGCGTTNFRGVLDADKTVGVATYGDPVNEQEMNILLRPAASPSQSDIAGTWHVNVITSGQDPGWMRGEVMVGANGVLSGMLAVSDNSQQPAMGTLTVAPDGTITHSLVPDMLCVLDSGKTVMVCTNSN